MINHIKGKIEEIGDNYIIIDNNGIGYQIYMPICDLNRVRNNDDVVKINTYHYIREDQISLYGFLDKDSMNMFSLLISVSGIGPRAALSILSGVTPQDMILSIMMGNEKMLCKCPGIGKKLAQRIILELKDKMKKYGDIQNMQGESNLSGDNCGEAIGALIALGYTTEEASVAVNKVYIKDEKIEETVKRALKFLVKG